MKRSRVGWLIAFSALSAPRGLQAQSELRSGEDLRELRRMELMHPAELALLHEGDARLAAADAQGAFELFERAARGASEVALLQRRRCQALTALGRPDAALAACTRALRMSGSSPAPTLRATVAALMAHHQPSSDQLAVALADAQLAADAAPGQPWGYAARCDVAMRLGDVALYQRCRADLRRIAPSHYETLRVEAAALDHTSEPVLLAWLLAALAAAGTLLHAASRGGVRRRVRRVARRAPGLAAALTALLVTPVLRAEQPPPDVQAGGLSKWPVNPQDPVSSVPTPEQRDANPVQFGYHLMDLADLADQAVKRQDFASAARFWEATVKAVPDSASGYRRACEFNLKAGDSARALPYCRGALGAQGVMVEDYRRYAELVLSQTTTLGKAELTDLDEIVEHLKSSGAGRAAADLECQLGLRVEDRARLERCTKVLGELAPNEPATISFEWALALMRGDLARAERLIDAARHTAMKPAGIQAMQRALDSECALSRRIQRNWLPLCALGALLLVAALSFARARRRSRLPLALGN